MKKLKSYKITNKIYLSDEIESSLEENETKESFDLVFEEDKNPKIEIRIPRQNWFEIECPEGDYSKGDEGYEENPHGPLKRWMPLSHDEVNKIDFLITPVNGVMKEDIHEEQLTFRYFYEGEKICEKRITIEVYEKEENIPERFKSIMGEVGPNGYIEVASIVISTTSMAIGFVL